MVSSEAPVLSRPTGPEAPHAASLPPLTGRAFTMVTGDFVTTGGMDRANYALVSYLARAGVAVDLVAHRVAEDLRESPNVRFHRVPKPLNAYALGAPLLARRGRRIAQRTAAGGGRVIVNGGNCCWGDVNWVHYVHAAHEPEFAPHTGWPRRARLAYSRRKFLADERRCLRAASIVIANSQRTRRDIIERVGIPAERVKTVYYGVDPAQFAPATAARRAHVRATQGWPLETPLVAFVGALGDRRKGFDVLYDAWKRLCRGHDWDVQLVVFGAGSQLPSLRRRAQEDGIAGRIRFEGFRADLPALLSACDCLASPTRYEAFGLGVQEALACAIPAIVSAEAGVAERYPQELEHLLLPDPDDPADLAARLLRWRSDPQRDRLALSRLSDVLRAHTWDRMAEDFLVAIGSPVPTRPPASEPVRSIAASLPEQAAP